MISKKFKDTKTKANRRCKFCGRGKLHWADTQYGWTLFNPDGMTHFFKEKGRLR